MILKHHGLQLHAHCWSFLSFSGKAQQCKECTEASEKLSFLCLQVKARLTQLPFLLSFWHHEVLMSKCSYSINALRTSILSALWNMKNLFETILGRNFHYSMQCLLIITFQPQSTWNSNWLKFWTPVGISALVLEQMLRLIYLTFGCYIELLKIASIIIIINKCVLKFVNI